MMQAAMEGRKKQKPVQAMDPDLRKHHPPTVQGAKGAMFSARDTGQKQMKAVALTQDSDNFHHAIRN